MSIKITLTGQRYEEDRALLKGNETELGQKKNLLIHRRFLYHFLPILNKGMSKTVFYAERSQQTEAEIKEFKCKYILEKKSEVGKT